MKTEKYELQEIKNELHHHADANTDYVVDNMPKRIEFEEASMLFSLLSDPTRIQIFWIIANSGECVYNIAKISNLSSPLVSFHLRYLKQAKMIVSSRHGKEVYYHIANNKNAKMLYNVLLELLKDNK